MKIATRFVKICAALTLALLSWNLMVGMTTVRLPRIYSDGPYGRHFEPGSNHVQCTEGHGRFQHDEQGYNNPAGTMTAAEAGQVPVVVAIGDSFTEALQLRRSDNFCSLLEQELQTRQPTLRVVNLGVSGRSMCDVLEIAGTVNERLRPQHVVVQCRIDDWLDDASDTTKHLHIERVDNRFQFASAAPEIQRLRQAKNRLVGAAPLLSWSYLRMRAMNPSVTSLLPDSLAGKPALAPAITKHTAAHQNDSRDQIDWFLSQLVERFPPEKLTILYIDEVSIPSDLHTDTRDGVTEQYLFQRCVETNVPVVRTRSAFLRTLRENHLPPTGFANSRPGRGHLNAAGHRIVAELLIRHLVEADVAK